jgi:hypothetical protein
MADDFADPFQYGLGDLPMEPPDTFNASYSAGRPNPLAISPSGAPPVVQAGFRLPLSRRFPPAQTPAPSQQVPPIRMPEIPDWLVTLMAALPKRPRRARSGLRPGNMDICDHIHKKNQDVCHERWRKGEYAHPDFYGGCLDNARQRWLDCREKGGQPSDLPVWGPEHEEIYIEPDR